MSFLGLSTYYRRFISRLANITKPLIRLIEADIPVVHRNRHRFPIAERGIVHTCPGLPPARDKFIVDDASNVGIGSVLYQVQGGRERVVAYFRRTLLKAEKILYDLLRVADNCENPGAFPQISIWTRVQITHRQLRVDLAAELYKPGGAHNWMGSASAGVHG
jgi:hypothetical protein